MKKRFAAMLLAAALCGGLLSGCAGKPAAPTPEAKKEIDVTTYYVKHNFPEEKLNDDEVLITAPAVNNFCYMLSNFVHGDLYVPYYYYNSLQVLFH